MKTLLTVWIFAMSLWIQPCSVAQCQEALDPDTCYRQQNYQREQERKEEERRREEKRKEEERRRAEEQERERREQERKTYCNTQGLNDPSCR